jgi:TetR/AcrR family transcriptional regulator, transcriptional repressor of bet genes
VILRKGLERTTVRDISREGGFTSGVLTHHFPDKQAVIVGAFITASESYETYVREELARADSPDELLRTLVAVSIPDSEARRAEWRLWSEMWTYAGHDTDFAEQLVATDARWEELIAGVLRRARDGGLLRPDLDVETHAGILARLIDGAGLRAWLSGDWAKARRQVVGHLAALGMPESMQATLGKTER